VATDAELRLLLAGRDVGGVRGRADNSQGNAGSEQDESRHHHSHLKTKEAAAASSSNRSLQWFPRLLAVADAIDRTCPVVGHEDRAVLGDHDVVGTAEIVLVAVDPAFGKDLLLGILAVGPDDHALDAGALVL